MMQPSISETRAAQMSGKKSEGSRNLRRVFADDAKGDRKPQLLVCECVKWMHDGSDLLSAPLASTLGSQRHEQEPMLDELTNH